MSGGEQDVGWSGGPSPELLYRLLRGATRFSLKAFYRTVEITGEEHLDPTKPTILASNHPNSIIDPLIVAISEQRQVSFAAQDGLFRITGFGFLLRTMGVIPIRRRSDYKGGPVDNRAAFAACRAKLLEGGVLSIFPEGRSHAGLRVERLKTGIARIALDAERERDYELDLRIVPVGLNYLVRQAFRSDVHIAFGPPIVVDTELAEMAAKDERAAVTELTARLDEALRDLAIHIEQQGDERVIAQVTWFVTKIREYEGRDDDGDSPAERTALVQRIIDAYRWLSEVDPERTADLKRRLQRHVDARAELGLGGEQAVLQHRGERRWTLGWRRRVPLFLFGAPFAAYGIVNTIVPYALMRLSMRVARISKDRMALFKILVGTALFLLCFTAQAALVWQALGTVPVVIYAATLLPICFFTLRYVTEARLHRLTLRSVWALWRKGERIDLLRIERQALRKEIAIARARYLIYEEAHEERSR